jgi:DNA-binding response OmpR family regulator
VQAFEDAGPALETADFEQADLIITDLQMPTPGNEAVRVIRSRGVHTPVLVMSGALDADKMDNLKSLGVQEFLEKPFNLRELLSRIQFLIGLDPRSGP